MSAYRRSAAWFCTPEHTQPAGGAGDAASVRGEAGTAAAASCRLQKLSHAGLDELEKKEGGLGASRDQSTPMRKMPEPSSAARFISTSGSVQKRRRSSAFGVLSHAWQLPGSWQNGSHASFSSSSTCAGAVATPKRKELPNCSGAGKAATDGGGGGDASGIMSHGSKSTDVRFTEKSVLLSFGICHGQEESIMELITRRPMCVEADPGPPPWQQFCFFPQRGGGGSRCRGGAWSCPHSRPS
eukprot:scaffold8849_cov101-Isochrysis_galbana.AAC.9